MERKTGLLLHPTSFPDGYGCGELGKKSYEIIDILAETGHHLLQVLSLGPTGYADSPYANFCAFAGNHYLISLDDLIGQGLLTSSDLRSLDHLSTARVDYGALYFHKTAVLRKAYHSFRDLSPADSRMDEYRSFCDANSYWLDDYANFMALKRKFGGASWNNWSAEWRDRTHPGITDPERLPETLLKEADFHRFLQYIFDSHWTAFHAYAADKGIRVIGDVPFNVLYDSSDVWSHRKLFCIDERGNPETVAGVPPDSFSATGQLWGNPNNRWEEMAKDGFEWWRMRFEFLHRWVDIIKLDHFRGFEAYWSIPAGSKTAEKGEWVKSPGMEFLTRLQEDMDVPLGECIIAEDLGIITEEVDAIRHAFNLPGMRILQFAPFLKDQEEEIWAETRFLPENMTEDTVAYTGTHDNSVLQGWFDDLPDGQKPEILEYFGAKHRGELNRKMIASLANAASKWVVVPAQDLLSLDASSRMNLPGTIGPHNWTWRLDRENFPI
jgi:4-alpha-glucanotransferase